MSKYIKPVTAPKKDKNKITITKEMMVTIRRKVARDQTDHECFVRTGYNKGEGKEGKRFASRDARRQSKQDCRRYQGESKKGKEE